ncbi:SNF2 family N-terminal domain-containing protein [Xylaria sp. FL0043]|nr:SNF2 family N-terminal domain-containing protein [Xylaria sp. FL0043]
MEGTSSTLDMHADGDVLRTNSSVAAPNAGSREISAIPKKRFIDNEGGQQKRRKANDKASVPQPDRDATVLPAVPVGPKEKSREELRQAILAAGKHISFSQPRIDDLNRAAQSLGLPDCQGPEDKWSIKGLLRPLYHHQLLALHFMLGRELSPGAPYGGLNADAMGLGKTAEALATMVMNPPVEGDIQEGRKVTLWVAPKNSHAQIKDAVRKFCCPTKLSNVLIYDKAALKKTHEDNLDTFLQNQDIIIVTYESLSRDCQAELIAKRGPMDHLTPELFRAKYIDKFGPLMKIQYYRVILDEAHRIKNTEAQMLRACSCLDTKYRWCLTGTPLLNSVAEIYPYFIFLQIPEVKNQNHSFEALCQIHEGTARLNDILKKIMIRRKTSDTILDRPLIELPTAHREVVSVTQTKDERVIYKWFAKKFRESFNKQLNVREYRERKGDEKRAFCIVNILRLRQMACDMSLIEYMIVRLSEFQDVQQMVRELSDQSGVNAFYDMISQWCEDQQRKLDTDSTSSTETPAQGAEADTSTWESDTPKYFMKPNLTFESRYFDNTTARPMFLGSKMRAIKGSIRKHLTDGPDDKLLIFNEFIYCAKLVGHILDDMKIKHVYYSGSHSLDVRDEAIEVFKSEPEIRVMILSMKCGCEALNLAFANRVITIEPWWNKGLEAQAFARVYRFGQEKEVYHTRIISTKAIETPVVALQDAKEITIENALEGKFSGQISSLEQAARLLGRVVYDDRGKIISVMDDNDEDSDIE